MGTEPTSGKATILLVEDSSTQALATEVFLRRNGYDVITVASGAAAITAVRTTPVDLVLLDLLLPDITGNEVCRWLKLNEETRGIPIIMLTVKETVEDKVAGLEAGADDYLAKPFNEVELNARIYAALRTKALQDELRRKNRQMEDLLARVEHLAITDPLTGLYNRRRVEFMLDKAWKSVKRYGGELSCFILDIDLFKSVNDAYGHGVGDAVLQKIAEAIAGCLREVDTVARWGGEEFLAILPQTGAEGARVVVERVLGEVRRCRFPALEGRQVTASVGIAALGGANDTPAKLIIAADLALLQAKANGRNRVEVAAPQA